MALAPWEEGVYVACMVKELVLPTDLAACHAMLVKQQHEIQRQTDLLEDQKIEIAKLEAERDAALQIAFRKKIERYCLTRSSSSSTSATRRKSSMPPRGSPTPRWRRSLATSGESRLRRRPAASSFRPTSRGMR
jgi:hypothetical protein